MPRIPFVTAADIAPSEQPFFDEFVRTRGAFPSNGPYATIGHLPEIALKLDSLRLALRDEASLAQPLQELVMITVAREMSCGYIWHAHAAAARKIGVRGDIIDNLRERRALMNLDPDQQAAVDYTLELLRERKVSRPTFDRASARFGQRGTIALTNLISCYAVLAYNMNTYEVTAPPGGTELPLPA
jgi:4-carboxymuconolactone decarboxylase